MPCINQWHFNLIQIAHLPLPAFTDLTFAGDMYERPPLLLQQAIAQGAFPSLKSISLPATTANAITALLGRFPRPLQIQGAIGIRCVKLPRHSLTCNMYLCACWCLPTFYPLHGWYQVDASAIADHLHLIVCLLFQQLVIPTNQSLPSSCV